MPRLADIEIHWGVNRVGALFWRHQAICKPVENGVKFVILKVIVVEDI